MNIETNRLNTFTDWPASAPVDPIRIAKAGFFYTGQGTEVQCFSCSGKISDWNYGDQVMWRHRNLEPNCAFVLNPMGSGNVPLVLGRACPDANPPTANNGSSVSSREEPPDYGVTEDDQMYQSDALRLLSFSNWTETSVSREALVNAGFYHAGEGRLRCAWCGGELSTFRNFGSMGHPLEVHRMYFPRCSHAALLESQRATTLSNTSSPTSPQSNTPPLRLSPDTTESHPQSSIRTGAVHNERVLSAGNTWRTLGVVGGRARHEQLAALAERLATFHRWPADRPQTPRALAEAGFFYTGTDDQVRCFYCDGGLGKWEASDAPWAEHARWFPHCGFVLLVKGPQFVDACRPAALANTAEIRPAARRSNSTNSANLPYDPQQVELCMESEMAMAALGAGLDAARVRRAIVRKLRATGLAFSSSEALIDAVLDEQLNEEAWSVSPRSQRLARDILAETLRDFAPRSGIIPSSQDDSSDSRTSPPDSPTRSPPPEPPRNVQNNPEPSRIIESRVRADSGTNSVDSRTEESKEEPTGQKLTLEEENRQLKEARLCKVCMDSEVSVVFLPCGHLVSCSGCGAALPTCPLCRAQVKALVRAYLA